MLNLAGPEFDLVNVVHAVLADGEHRRRAFFSDVAGALQESTQRKLATIRKAYDDTRSDPAYWEMIEHEVLGTVLPQYAPLAAQQNHLEQTSYGVWRNGDLGARLAFTLAGLVIGGIIIAVPFIPIFIDAFAFFLAFLGWFYPDLKKLFHDFSYNRRLNALLADALRFQQRNATAYLSLSSIDRLLSDPHDETT